MRSPNTSHCSHNHPPYHHDDETIFVVVGIVIGHAGVVEAGDVEIAVVGVVVAMVVVVGEQAQKYSRRRVG